MDWITQLVECRDSLETEDFLFQKGKVDDTLLIAFSSRFVRHFELANSLKNVPYSKLHLLDQTGTSWWCQGIKGISADPIESAERLKDLTAKLGIKKIYCIGLSMGGTGAFLFGGLIGAERCIAFTPQIVYRDNYPFCPEKQYWDNAPDINMIISNSPDTHFDLLSSRDLHDIYQASTISHQVNVSINILPCEHGLLRFVREMMGLQEFMYELLVNNFQPIQSIEFGKTIYTRNLSLLEQLVDSYYAKDHSKTLNFARRLFRQDFNSFELNWMIGLILFNLQQYPESIRFLNKAYFLDNSFEKIYLILIPAYLAVKNCQKCYELLSESLGIFQYKKKIPLFFSKPLPKERINSINLNSIYLSSSCLNVNMHILEARHKNGWMPCARQEEATRPKSSARRWNLQDWTMARGLNAIPMQLVPCFWGLYLSFDRNSCTACLNFT